MTTTITVLAILLAFAILLIILQRSYVKDSEKVHDELSLTRDLFFLTTGKYPEGRTTKELEQEISHIKLIDKLKRANLTITKSN